MTFYLVSAVLIGVLVLATWRVARMHQELRDLRAHHREFEQSMSDATAALIRVGRLIDKIYGDGGRVLLDLGASIEEGRALAALIQGLTTSQDGHTVAHLVAKNAGHRPQVIAASSGQTEPPSSRHTHSQAVRTLLPSG